MDRRGFLLGVGTSLVAAPSIVRAGSLMPVRSMALTTGALLQEYIRQSLPFFEPVAADLVIFGKAIFFNGRRIDPADFYVT